jgi:hypothetical protein
MLTAGERAVASSTVVLWLATSSLSPDMAAL